MALASKTSGWLISAVVSEPGFEISAALQAQNVDVGFQISAVLLEESLTERRVVADITTGSALSDQHYGVFEPQEATVEIDNLDGALSFMAEQNPEGALLQILRFDGPGEDLRECFSGGVTQATVGDTIRLRAADQDLELFTRELPRHRIFSGEEALPADLTPADVTVVFPNAPDQNAPIPIVFGRVTGLPLAYLAADEENSTFDYLVCEGSNVDVEEVFKDDQPGYRVRGTVQAATATTLQLASVDQGSSALMVGLILKIVAGPGAGQQREVLAFDEATQTCTVSTWDVTPSINSIYETREYLVLSGFPYLGRTAIRFRQRQVYQGEVKALTATVARYTLPVKNLLWDTDSMADEYVWSTVNSVASRTPIDGPDGLVTSAVRLVPDPGEAVFFQQVTAQVPKTTSPYTFSTYMRLVGAPVAITVTMRVRRANGADTQSKDVSIGPSWLRYEMTHTPSWDGSSSPLSVILQAATTNRTIDVACAQLEEGGFATYYEGVAYEGQATHWSYPNAIGELLGHPFWGLNQAVNEGSIRTANQNLDGLFLKCQGAVPAIGEDRQQAKDVLDSMMTARGFLMRRQGGAWSVFVDMPGQQPFFTVGTGDTPYPQIYELGDVQHRQTTEAVQTLRVEYGLTRNSKGENIYAKSFRYAVADVGREEIRQLKFCQDDNTADRIGQYLRGAFQMGARSLELTVGQIGRNAIAGDVIAIVAPRRQPANWLPQSERLYGSPWLGSGTVNALAGPNRRHTRGQWHTATTVQRGFLVGPTVHNGQRIITHLWMRSWAGSVNVPFSIILSPSTTWQTKTFTVGVGWQRYTADFTLPNTGATIDTSVQITVPSGATIATSEWQTCLEYDYPYIRTDSVGLLPQQLWRIVRADRQIDLMKFTVEPYDSDALFAYEKSPFPLAPNDSSDYDPRLVPPDPATDLVVPPSPAPNVVTAAAGVDLSPEGVADSWGEVSFLMPARGATHVHIQRRKLGDSFWETNGRVSTTEVAAGQRATVILRTFTPGIRYEIRTIAVNSAGLTTPGVGVGLFTAWGDLIPPPAPDALTLRQTVGARTIEVTVGMPTVSTTVQNPDGTQTTVPKIVDDLAYIRLYRGSTAGTPNTNGGYASGLSLVDRSAKLQFHDASVTLDGATYYYFVRAEDYSGNLSPYFPNNGVLIVPDFDIGVAENRGYSVLPAEAGKPAGHVRFGDNTVSKSWGGFHVKCRVGGIGGNVAGIDVDNGSGGVMYVALGGDQLRLDGAYVDTTAFGVNATGTITAVIEIRSAAGGVIGYIPVYATYDN